MCSNRQGAHTSQGTNPILPPHPVFDPRVSRAQGYLWKKGQLRRNWSERWFTLKPSVLSYYMSEERKEKKGSIALDKHCCVEVRPGACSARGQEMQETPFRPREGEPKNTQFHIRERGRARPATEESGDEAGYGGVMPSCVLSLQVLPDRDGKRCMFCVKTPSRTYEMSASDTRQRQEWTLGPCPPCASSPTSPCPPPCPH